MLEINKEYEKVRLLSTRKWKEFLTRNEHKDDREIHILGAFTKLLELGGCPFPYYYKKEKPPEPDFSTYCSDGKNFKSIEIVENMHWGRKRGDEYKVPFDRNKYIDQVNKCKIRVWYSFIRNLNEKFLKFYGDDTWLLMYHNINVYHISNTGFWFNIIFGMKEEIEKRKLVDFSKSTYENIFVINSGFTELVQIYPENKIIFSEYSQFSRT